MSTYAEMSYDEIMALRMGNNSLSEDEDRRMVKAMQRKSGAMDALCALAQDLDDAGLVVVPASLWDRACTFWPFFAMACVADGVASPPPTREA